MDWIAILVAGLAYFALGGLWFTPLFGTQWDRAVGFARPPKWRPAAEYYLGPLLGCLIATTATAVLFRIAEPATLRDAVALGAVVGLGYGAAITGVNAIAPNMPRPALYAAVTGGYHCAGLLVAASILFVLSA